jgi:hypothetical protein
MLADAAAECGCRPATAPNVSGRAADEPTAEGSGVQLRMLTSAAVGARGSPRRRALAWASAPRIGESPRRHCGKRRMSSSRRSAGCIAAPSWPVWSTERARSADRTGLPARAGPGRISRARKSPHPGQDRPDTVTPGQKAWRTGEKSSRDARKARPLPAARAIQVLHPSPSWVGWTNSVADSWPRGQCIGLRPCGALTAR